MLIRLRTWAPDGETGSPGTETPTAAPAAATTEGESELLDTLTDDGPNDDDIFRAFEGLEPVEEPVVSSAPVAPTVTSAAAQPTTSAAATPSTPTESAAPAISSAAVTPTPAEAPSSAAAAITDPVEAYQSWRGNAEKALAEGWYNLSDEQLSEFEANPKEFLPRMAARVYLDAVTAATNVLARNLPQIIDNHFATRNATDAAEARFFAQWPGLKEKSADVIRFAKSYRHLNPAADEATFIRDVGAQVAVALGIPAEKARAQAAAPAAAVSPPAQQTLPPHRPPAAGAHHVGGQPGATSSPFEGLLGDD